CMGVGRSLDVRFDPATFDAEIERIDIDDTRLSPVWGDHVSRVLLHVTAPAALGNWILTMAAGGN
ncbi:MAG: hypothetical protein M3440_06265, partial [Chloroflexota bacterium]|nr:hypothetical protein [Chloroflexota bacterium]